MKLTAAFRLLIFIIISISMFSCSGKKEEFVSEQPSNYTLLQPGKYITYRLDSLVFTSFGHNVETHSYQVKHVCDSQLPDNLGRPSYRIYTYIRDSAGTEPWVANGSYFITPLPNRIEVIEDNLRVIKLQAPMKEGFDWKGNAYLPDEPYYETYDFNNDNDMKNWDFTYDTFEPASTYRGNSYNDVYTVLEEDDHLNVPVTDPTTFGFKTLSVEKYSKNIGMVYRQYIMWEYQPNPSGPNPYNTGFGITLWMIDHN